MPTTYATIKSSRPWLHTATLLHCTAPLHRCTACLLSSPQKPVRPRCSCSCSCWPLPWVLALAKQSGRPRLVSLICIPPVFTRCAIPSAARDSTHQSPISVPEPTPPWPAHTPAHVCTLTARPSASASRLRLVCAPATAHPPANELAAERRTACTCKHHLPADLSMRFPKSKHPVAQPNITTTHTSQQ